MKAAIKFINFICSHNMDIKNNPIGFFDSGVGGLSVLKESIKLLPNESFIYFGDSKNAPYGVKKVDDVKILTFKAVDFLLEKNVKAIVIACNTATSAAIDDLRKKYKSIPIIGIEPALKPAVELKRKGKIVIMATPMTLSETKFEKLMKSYEKEAEIVPMPCKGLAELIESGVFYGEELNVYLKDKYKHLKKEDLASIVLGCTHYPFIKEALKNIIGNDTPIIDGSAGTSMQLKRLLIKNNILNEGTKKGTVQVLNSSDKKEMMDLCQKLLIS